jgi:hypothetical protein
MKKRRWLPHSKTSRNFRLSFQNPAIFFKNALIKNLIQVKHAICVLG